MDQKRKKKSLFFTILVLMFIFFTTLYLSELTGIGEYTAYKKTQQVNAKIIEFEEDLKSSGISNKVYIKKRNNYSNRTSSAGYKISTTIENIFNIGIKNVFKYLNDLISE